MTTWSNSPLEPIEVRFPSEGQMCAASLYRPLGVGPFPVIVMAHGLGGTRRMRLPAYAERFVTAGYACLIFDYRHFGESDGEPRQLLDIGKQLLDWQAAIEYARGLEDINPDQVVIWGTSFGGGHVIATAAKDGRLAAAIAQCPFTDGFASALTVDPITSLKLTAIALVDRIGSWFGAAPKLVSTAGRPGEVALMNAPDAFDGYLALAADGEPVKNQVAARFGLDIIRHFPGRMAGKITCPILFCVCETDSVAPAKATLRHAARAPHGEIKTYPDGHFDIYRGAAFERVVNDQLDFLSRTLPRR